MLRKGLLLKRFVGEVTPSALGSPFFGDYYVF
jgi:hypothetical protein